MNEAMKLENIQAYAQSHELQVENNVVYTMIDAKLWKYALFQGAAALSIQHFLTIFDKAGLTLIGLTQTGDFTETVLTIQKESMTNVAFKKGLLQSKLTFDSVGQHYVLKIPNIVAVAKWQKEHLQQLQLSDFLQT